MLTIYTPRATIYKLSMTNAYCTLHAVIGDAFVELEIENVNCGALCQNMRRFAGTERKLELDL